MEYMPEYYSSNVKQLPSTTTHSTTTKKPVKQSKVFYILKDNFLEEGGSSSPLIQAPRSVLSSKDQIGAKNVVEKLLYMLEKQPNKFQEIDLINPFDCKNKRLGLHRDPYDCTKYYFCSNKNFNNTISQEIITKAFSCQPNVKFNMNGCFCDPKLDSRIDECDLLIDTYCDVSVRKIEEQFS